MEVDFDREITSDKDLTYTGWDRHAIPYGDNRDDETVGEILDGGQEAVDSEAAKMQMALPLPGDGEKKS